MKKVLLAIAIVIIVGSGYFLLKENENSQQHASPPTSSTSQQSAQPETHLTSVTFTDDGFSPNVITVKKGESVTWKNQSSEGMWIASAFHPTHTAYDGTSLSQHCPGNGTAFDQCENGASFSFAFLKTGTWNYHNHLDAGKTGSVTVTE